MISIKQLRYFSAVAQTGHFGSAAEQCAVTQPALSMQIQDLEKELGLQLLERGRKGVSLTPGGREIAERAARVLADVNDLVDSARQLAGSFSGTLRFGAIPSIAPYLLPQLLPLIRATYPDLDLLLRETQTQRLLDELVDGQLDVVLLALPVEHAGIETAPLFVDRFLLALPASYKISGSVRATPDLLRNDRLLLLEEGHCLRDQALAFCELRQVGSIDTFGASSLSTLVQMVANGLGLTLLPEISVDLETRRADVRLMRFAEPEPSRVLGLAWRATSPRKRDFVELGKLIASVSQRRRLPKAAA
jgi:LysR family transcriptional regulator, hydrogen peroxide-inducible genes activator